MSLKEALFTALMALWVELRPLMHLGYIGWWLKVRGQRLLLVERREELEGGVK